LGIDIGVSLCYILNPKDKIQLWEHIKYIFYYFPVIIKIDVVT
jgi:hypothetical protein